MKFYKLNALGLLIMMASYATISNANESMPANNKTEIIDFQNELLPNKNISGIGYIVVSIDNMYLNKGEYLVSSACSDKSKLSKKNKRRIRADAINQLSFYLEDTASLIKVSELESITSDNESIEDYENSIFSNNINNRSDRTINSIDIAQLNADEAGVFCSYIGQMLTPIEIDLNKARVVRNEAKAKNRQLEKDNAKKYQDLDELMGFYEYGINEYNVPSIITVAIGTASMNSAMPRQMALKNAQINALQQVLGTTVSSNTLSSIVDNNGETKDLFAEYSKEELEGTVEDYTILRQGEVDGLYAVKIEATIDPSTVLNDMEKAIKMLGSPKIFIESNSDVLKDHLSNKLLNEGVGVVSTRDNAGIIITATSELMKQSMKQSWYEISLKMTMEEAVDSSKLSILENTPSYIPFDYEASKDKILRAYLKSFENSNQVIKFLKRGVIKIHNAGGMINRILIDPRLNVDINTLIQVIEMHPRIALIASKDLSGVTELTARMMGGEIEIGHILMPLIASHSSGIDTDKIQYMKMSNNQYQYRYDGEVIELNKTENKEYALKNEEDLGLVAVFLNLLMDILAWIMSFFRQI